MTTNFENVKVGDIVAYECGLAWNHRKTVARVTKVTLKQFMVGNDKFRKSDGVGIGFSDYAVYCRYATQDDIDDYNRRYLLLTIRNHFRSNACEDLTLAQLKAINEILNQKK